MEKIEKYETNKHALRAHPSPTPSRPGRKGCPFPSLSSQDAYEAYIHPLPNPTENSAAPLRIRKENRTI